MRSTCPRFFALFICLAATTVAAPAQSTRPSLRPLSPQELVIAYWTTEPGWSSQLEIGNNLPNRSLVVAPILHTASGTTIPLAAVTLGPQEVTTVDLASAILTSNQAITPSEAYGSVSLRFNGLAPRNAYGAVLVQRSGHPMDYHFDAMATDAGVQKRSFESIWWLPRATADAYLIIANHSSAEAQGHLAMTGGDASSRDVDQFSLAPYQTLRVSVGEAVQRARFSDTFGGVEVAMDSGGGQVEVSNIGFDEAAGFAATMRVFELDARAKTETITLRAPLVALARPDAMLNFPVSTVLEPMLLLRNASNHAMPAQLAVNWKSANLSGNGAVTTLSLAPGVTHLVDLAAMQRGGVIPANANWASAAITYDGREGELVPVAASYDSAGRYGVQSPFKTEMSFMYKGGMWRVDSTRDSLLTVGNGGDRMADLRIKLLYGAGNSYELPASQVAPGGQVWVKIGDLVRKQLPDRHGNFLPPNVSEGTYDIEDVAEPNVGYLFEGELIADKTFGTATYGCTACCGFNGAGMDPGNYTGDVGSGEQFAVEGENECTGLEQDLTAISQGWASSNTSVAKLSGTAKGDISCVGAGTAEISSWVKLSIQGTSSCPFQQINMGSGITVHPTVNISGQSNIALLAPGAQGANSTALAAVDQSPPGGSYAWTLATGSGVVTLNNVSSDTVAVTSQAVGSATVKLTYTVNGQSGVATKAVTVQQPKFLAIVSQSSTTSSEASCATSSGGNGCGVARTFIYQVLDQSGAVMQIPGMQFWDKIATGSTNGCGLTSYATTCSSAGLPQSGPCGKLTDGFGQFLETLSICSTTCKSGAFCTTGCSTSANQAWNVNGFDLTSDVKALSYQCNACLVNQQ